MSGLATEVCLTALISREQQQESRRDQMKKKPDMSSLNSEVRRRKGVDVGSAENPGVLSAARNLKQQADNSDQS